MGVFSIWHWIIALLAVLVVFLPIWFGFRILKKAGRNGWWSLLIFFPTFLPIGIWVFAFLRWPAIDKPPGSSAEPAADAEPA